MTILKTRDSKIYEETKEVSIFIKQLFFNIHNPEEELRHFNFELTMKINKDKGEISNKIIHREFRIYF